MRKGLSEDATKMMGWCHCQNSFRASEGGLEIMSRLYVFRKAKPRKIRLVFPRFHHSGHEVAFVRPKPYGPESWRECYRKCRAPAPSAQDRQLVQRRAPPKEST